MKEDGIFFVFNKQEYLSFIRGGAIPFTEEDIEKAQAREDGVVGTRCGATYYLSKPIPSVRAKTVNNSPEPTNQGVN